jgi:Outer membrane protein beta-barrel domain
MKRSLIAILSLCSLPAIAQAQGGIGIKGGLSYGNVSNGGALPGAVAQRSGLAIGLSAATGGVIGLGVEALYVQRGVTSSVPNNGRRLDYLDVPLYLRLALPTAPLSPFAYAGPQSSFELNCTTDNGKCPDTGRPSVSYAGVIGAGLQFGMQSRFSLEGRYVYGLTDLKLNTVSTSDSYQTRSFMLLAGFTF